MDEIIAKSYTLIPADSLQPFGSTMLENVTLRNVSIHHDADLFEMEYYSVEQRDTSPALHTY